MRISDKRQAATQYALLTALYALPRSLLAPIGGWIADHWGYSTFFFWTFLLAAPAYFLLPWVYRWIGGNGRPAEETGAPAAGIAPDGRDDGADVSNVRDRRQASATAR